MKPQFSEWDSGRQGDKETRRQGDKETRRQGDKESERRDDHSPCLPLSLSPTLPPSLPLFHHRIVTRYDPLLSRKKSSLMPRNNRPDSFGSVVGVLREPARMKFESRPSR